MRGGSKAVWNFSKKLSNLVVGSLITLPRYNKQRFLRFPINHNNFFQKSKLKLMEIFIFAKSEEGNLSIPFCRKNAPEKDT